MIKSYALSTRQSTHSRVEAWCALEYDSVGNWLVLVVARETDKRLHFVVFVTPRRPEC